MKIVIAIDSFKGCLGSLEAGEAAREGVLGALPDADVQVLQVSDGGEGMMEAFTSAMDGTTVAASTHDALMRPITAHYGISRDGTTAVVEMAQAAGLMLVAEHERDAVHATTFGVGELIADAIARGCRRLIVGLGGSATSDAGVGMLQALGVKFMRDDEVLEPGSVDLNDITSIDVGGFDAPCRFDEVIIASDVQNPLFGLNGSAHVYAPQKGASPEMVEHIDAGMRHLSTVVNSTLKHDSALTPGAGAAGGLGYAMITFFNAAMHRGSDLLMDVLDFDSRVSGAALVLTGEGSADRQTLMGKLPQAVMQRAGRVPTVLIAGRVNDRDALVDAGFADARCINPPLLPLAEAMRPEVARRNIAATVEQVCRDLLCCR